MRTPPAACGACRARAAKGLPRAACAKLLTAAPAAAAAAAAATDEMEAFARETLGGMIAGGYSALRFALDAKGTVTRQYQFRFGASAAKAAVGGGHARVSARRPVSRYHPIRAADATANCATAGVKERLHAWVIGKDGKIFWHGGPTGGAIGYLSQRIDEALAQEM